MKRLSILAALLVAASAASAAPATIGEAPTYPGDMATTTRSAQTRHDARAQADAATPYVFLNNEGPLVDNPAYRGKAASTDRSFVRVDGPYYMN